MQHSLHGIETLVCLEEACMQPLKALMLHITYAIAERNLPSVLLLSSSDDVN